MPPPRATSWLTLIGVLAPAAAVLVLAGLLSRENPGAVGLPAAEGEVAYVADAGRGLSLAAVRELPAEAWQEGGDPTRGWPGCGARGRSGAAETGSRSRSAR